MREFLISPALLSLVAIWCKLAPGVTVKYTVLADDDTGFKLCTYQLRSETTPPPSSKMTAATITSNRFDTRIDLSLPACITKLYQNPVVFIGR